MSINWKKSAELNGMPENELKEYFEKYPGSGKRVVAICDGGCENPERVVIYQDYRDLCNSCSKKKRFEDPEERKKMGESQKKSYKGDPLRSQRQSESQKKRYEDDPTLSENHGEFMKKYYTEMDDTAQDIINHHIAYDFDHPEVLTVQVTRRFHGQIHHPKGQKVTERSYSLID